MSVLKKPSLEDDVEVGVKHDKKIPLEIQRESRKSKFRFNIWKLFNVILVICLSTVLYKNYIQLQQEQKLRQYFESKAQDICKEQERRFGADSLWSTCREIEGNIDDPKLSSSWINQNGKGSEGEDSSDFTKSRGDSVGQSLIYTWYDYFSSIVEGDLNARQNDSSSNGVTKTPYKDFDYDLSPYLSDISSHDVEDESSDDSSDNDDFSDSDHGSGEEMKIGGKVTTKTTTVVPPTIAGNTPLYRWNDLQKIFTSQNLGGRWNDWQKLSTTQDSGRNLEEKDNSTIKMRIVPDPVKVASYKRLWIVAGYAPVWIEQGSSVEAGSYFSFQGNSFVRVAQDGLYKISAKMTFQRAASKKLEFAIVLNYMKRIRCRIVDEEDDFDFSNDLKPKQTDTSNLALTQRSCSTELTLDLTPLDVVKIECQKGCKRVVYEPELTYWEITTEMK